MGMPPDLQYSMRLLYMPGGACVKRDAAARAALIEEGGGCAVCPRDLRNQVKPKDVRRAQLILRLCAVQHAQHRLRIARAVVGYAEREAAALERGGQGDRAAACVVACAVGKQVGDCAVQQRAVRDDLSLFCVAGDAEVQRAAVCQTAVDKVRRVLAQKRADGQRLRAQRLRVVLQLGGEVQVLDQRADALALAGWPPVQIALYMLRGLLGALAVAALQLLLSMVIRSFAVPVLIALVGGVVGMALVAQDAGLCWPYALVLLGMNANRAQDQLTGGLGAYVLSCLGFALLFCLLAQVLLTRRDVRA